MPRWAKNPVALAASLLFAAKASEQGIPVEQALPQDTLYMQNQER